MMWSMPITWRCETAEGSSMEQNQKLRRSTSLGNRSLGQALLSLPEAEWAIT